MIGCVLGIRTQGCKMVGADETTELWLPPRLLSLWSVSSVSGIPSAPRRSHSSTSTTSRPCKRWRTFCKALTRTRRRTWSTSTGSLSTGESAKHRIPSVTSASESTKLKVGDRIQRCMVESSTFYEVYLLMITQFTVYVR